MELKASKQNKRTFYHLLANTLLSGIINMTVWFALIFYIYLQTESVLANAFISGIYLVLTSASSIWFGSLVDNNKKKIVMIISSIISLILYIAGFALYIINGDEAFTEVGSVTLWSFVMLLMLGVTAGNLRGIAIPTVVAILFDEKERDKANGLVGTTSGITFLIVSVISAILVGQSGMYGVMILATLLTLLTVVHLLFVDIPEKEIVHTQNEDGTSSKKIDVKGTFKIIRGIPGLLPLIIFTTVNNLLGGVFMALMDPYGLSLVSVEVWGVMWGFLSSAFIIGGIIVAKFGLGKNPLRTMFTANIIIWIISCFFTIQPWIWLLVGGMYIYLCVVPFIEAAEQTIFQKVVPQERLGRVFGLAHSIEQAASPLTAFIIGPLTQFIFIPFMTTGSGVDLIGSWFGTGEVRGMALVFTVTGFIGLVITLIARNSKFYHQLSERYLKG